MANRKFEYMKPRDGKTFRVLISVRISGCTNQKDQSKEDQEQHCKDEVKLYFDGEPVEFTVIKCTAKGELLERAEIVDLEEHIRTGRYDLLMVEDLGRLLRDVVAKHLFGLAKDHKTRAVSINDCVDTDEDNWEEVALTACADHVGHNRHVSRRIKQKSMNRFRTRGELFQQPIAGYVRYKGDGLCDMKKLSEHNETIVTGAKKILSGATDMAVADWFNSIGFTPGPFSDASVWKSPAVRRFYTNPILAGKPYRGKRTSQKNYESGKRRPVKNPDGPITIDRPELAHLDEGTFERLQHRFAERAEKYRRAQNGDDPLEGVPRSRSRYPGHCSVCWYCGSTNVWGANGVTDGLMCRGSRDRTCWCSFGVDGPRLTRAVLDMIEDHLKTLPGFADQFREMLQEAKKRKLNTAGDSPEALERELSKILEAQRRTADAVAATGGIEALITKLKTLQADERCVRAKMAEAVRKASRPLQVPETLDNMLSTIRACLEGDIESFELAEALRVMTRSIHTYAVRLIDSAYPEMRARIVLDLSALWPDLKNTPKPESLFVITKVVDLFTSPQRVVIREESVRLRATGLKLHEIAAKIGVTETAVQHAIKLDEVMNLNGVQSPYVMVTCPSELGAKYRRHLHPKYRFTVQPGCIPPPL